MALVKWVFLDPRVTIETLGYIPYWLNDSRSAGAREQLDQGYKQYGGWMPFKGGFKMDPRTKALLYPGDPPQLPLALAILREETILFYSSSWVAVVQKDGSFEVCRMD